ncbi:MAG TPA: HEAT repeat domain-containing protein [Kofleriaceae bacterium]|nr:HEAT repeat domain-containing protein [Kofleriaceae bacterium]
MARKPDFDLAAELAKPSFTPAVKDAPALVDLVIEGHERAGDALATLGATARTAIEQRLTPELVARDRAALISVLGQLARKDDATARDIVIAQLSIADSQVRKAAVQALGKIAGEEATRVLLGRWDASDVTPDERRALAEALGKVGGEAALSRLRALDPGDDAELARRRDRALLMAGRDAKRSEDSYVRVDVAPTWALDLRLRCKSGLAPLLREELGALGIRAKVPLDDSADIVLEKPWSALFASRLWASAAIRVPLAAIAAKPAAKSKGEAPSDDPRAIVDVLTSDRVRELFRAWTSGPIRWRLGFAEGKQRAAIWRVAKDVTARAPELVNDPSQTTWDVRIDDDSHGDRVLEISPKRYDDPRFAWRVAEVPAASHPSVAAALAYVAADGAAKSGVRVWDPFCGSGAELVERSVRGGVAALVGTDLDDAALDAAKRNIDAAKLTATLAKADARSHDPGSVDLVITNPPLGSRVHVDAGKLLVDALPNFVKRLAPGGRLVWITPQTKKTSPVAERLGLRLAKRYAVDLGGVRGHLERWDR